MMIMSDYLLIFICCISVLFLSRHHQMPTAPLASVIAPFEYTAIPFGAFWGVVIWGEWPTPTLGLACC